MGGSPTGNNTTPWPNLQVKTCKNPIKVGFQVGPSVAILVITMVLGTFAQVCLCLHKYSSKYFAMKILSIDEVIKLKQVQHVKSEKKILQVHKNKISTSTNKQCLGNSASLPNLITVEL